MTGKTITQPALDAGVETGGTENALAILKFAKAYADQEKRSTAIAFAEWVSRTGYKWQDAHESWGYAPWKPVPKGGKQIMSIAELYDLYLQSLPK